MESNSISTFVNYNNIEIPITHTQFSTDKVKAFYWQRVDFLYKQINVMYSYKSDDLSPWLPVQDACKAIDLYGKDWGKHIKEKDNG